MKVLSPACALATVLTCLPAAFASTGILASSLGNFNDANLLWNIAELGTPMFHFAQANGYPMCYPTYPFRPDGSKRPAVGQENWPKISGCKQADLNARGWGPKMPVYFTTKKCPDRSGRANPGGTEIRVSYSLFWEKDGFVGNGHDYDWENVVVIWRNYNGWYYKDEIKLSTHKTWRDWVGWDSIPQTVNNDNFFESGGKNKDHVKVYVGWCKHALFFEKRTAFSTIVACLDGTEMRSDDWYYVANSKDTLISANPGTENDGKFRSNDWGSATSKPSAIYDRLCDI